MSGSFAIAVGRFYGELAERLLAGTREAFAEDGDHALEVFDVPGAFELPLAASYAARSGRFPARASTVHEVARTLRTHFCRRPWRSGRIGCHAPLT